MAYVGDQVPLAEKQAVIARFIAGTILGQALGPFFGGLLTDFFGWRGAFATLGAIFLAVAAILFIRTRTQWSGDTRAHATDNPFTAHRRLLGSARVRWVLGIAFADAFLFFGAYSFLGAFLKIKFDLSLTVIGAILAGFGAGGVLYPLMVGPLLRRFGQPRLLTWSGAACALAYLLIVATPLWPAAVLGTVALGYSFYMLHNTVQIKATEMAPQARGAAVAIYASFWALGQAVGVAAMSVLVGFFGFTVSILAFAIGFAGLGLWIRGTCRDCRERISSSLFRQFNEQALGDLRSVLKILLPALVALALVVWLATFYGARRWQAATNALHAGLDTARAPVEPRTFDPAELAGLPAPVQRYFRAALKEGQPMVAAATVEHSGTFNTSEAGEEWRSFTSAQRVVAKRPGFVWDARITMLPGLSVRVHDAYVAGEGILHATLFGLVSLANLRGTPEMAHGELMRFFAETAWYPTALLPSQGVRWEAIDERSAKATLIDGGTMVALVFRFDESGLIASVRAETRGRMVEGATVPTPWEGRWRNYAVREGMRVPLEGEVAWLLPEGPKPYWRGRIASIAYEFAR
jgi:MFS family permease